MSLIGLLLVVIIVGLIVWLINYLPIAQPFKTVAMVIVVLILIIWLFSMLGGVGLGTGFRLR